MVRISVVIQNSKGEYLICKCPLTTVEEKSYEFAGGEILGIEIPYGNNLDIQVNKICYDKLGITVEDIHEMEIFWSEEIVPWIHVIYSAKIKSGNPEKRFYKKILWKSLDEMQVRNFNLYGYQVFVKLNECSYCRLIHCKKELIDEFFNNFFDTQEAYLGVLESLSDAEEGSTIYEMAFKQILLHLRASLIETESAQKNITVQNYFKLYERKDLADEVDSLLEINITPELTLREMIKESVDKYIAHYDKPTQKSREIFDMCKTILSPNGKFPLHELMKLLDTVIMSLITEMWYDAGELGVKMSERSYEKKAVLRAHRYELEEQLMYKLKDSGTNIENKEANL